ncbi:BatD family protein [Pukyongiella litopenaei]|uniref:Protein BatD n=1 Tax=Pukyongiella litopenaei TaxID=2605946 RepID=A0A2S0MTE9_9RHOB|nr:BatD family protein [Pukyongiella litopenaei]AVO39077.1 protein BatD [Pukyongiella litopenaei]
MIRRLHLILVLALVLPGPVRGQGADTPQLRVRFPETETIPGQSLSLRLTVLVPTFMPDPPVWPSMELPNLLVRLPGRSTNPTSERIGGETWSGVTRHYRLSPMVPGNFTIPAQDVVVTWNNPATGETEKVTLVTDPVAFRGVVPEGAGGLDPFIAASDLHLTQQIDGTPEAMTPGQSFTRTVRIEVQGVSPMFLPPLMPSGDIPGIAAYPDEPVVEETDTRGDPGGARTESVTFVAEGGTEGVLPAVSLDWFDIDAGEVRTAQAETVAIRVDGPPVSRAEPRDRRVLAAIAVAALLVAWLIALALRRVMPALRHRIDARRRDVLASEAHAWRVLTRALAARDHAALRPALDLWASRAGRPDPRRDAGVQSALLALGAAQYGRAVGAGNREGAAWDALGDALRRARRVSASRPEAGVLPPLNPEGAA